jgi:hypothetical protein
VTKCPWQVSWLPARQISLTNLRSFPVISQPVDRYAIKPVTVALPQRIHTAFPFHPNRFTYV